MPSGARRRRSRSCCSARTRASSRRVSRTRWRVCRRRRRRIWCSQVEQHLPLREPRAAGRRPLPDSHRAPRSATRPRAHRRASWSRSIRCRRSSRRCRRPCSSSYSQYGDLAALREPLKIQLPSHAHAGAAAGDAGRDLRRDLLRAAPGASGAGPDRGHARGRQGRLRHAPAAALARRDGLPGALLQRHDQAAAARARRGDAQPAGGRARARAPGDHPGAPVHRGARHRSRR